MPFSERCRRERVRYEDALDACRENGVQIMMNGQGLIGAVAALAFFARPDESVVPGWQKDAPTETG